MLVRLVALLLVVSPTLTAGGAVRRDPVTGKWVEASDSDVVADPRAHSGSAEGGDDGGFFGGISFVDHRTKDTVVHDVPAAAASSDDSFAALPSLSDVDSAGVMTRDLTPRTSKYSRDIPMDLAMANVQTQAQAVPIQQELEEQDLVQATQSSVVAYKTKKIQSFVHEVPAELTAVQIGQAALPTRAIGNLCRFQGFAPLTPCPKEAMSGCVDRIPCTRTCKTDAYFNYRCKGPTVVPKTYAMAAAQETPVPRPPSEDYVKLLTEKLKGAMQANDYSALARLIVNAQQGRGAAAAASALAQISQAISVPAPADGSEQSSLQPSLEDMLPQAQEAVDNNASADSVTSVDVTSGSNNSAPSEGDDRQ